MLTESRETQGENVSWKAVENFMFRFVLWRASKVRKSTEITTHV